MLVFGSSRIANDQAHNEKDNEIKNTNEEIHKPIGGVCVRFFFAVVIIITMVMVVVNFVIRATRSSVAFPFCAGWWLHRIGFEMILERALRLRFDLPKLHPRQIYKLVNTKQCKPHNYIVSNDRMVCSLSRSLSSFCVFFPLWIIFFSPISSLKWCKWQPIFDTVSIKSRRARVRLSYQNFNKFSCTPLCSCAPFANCILPT